MTSYPGGKGGDGVYQTIINQIPPHITYIEPFLGGGAIMRHKASAHLSIGVDADEHALEMFRGAAPGVFTVNGDGVKYLQNCAYCQDRSTFVYCDPPYLMTSRSSKRNLYTVEMGSMDEHLHLLEVLLKLPCMVALSGYPNDLYDQVLVGWRTIEFKAMTRAAVQRTEKLWMNYPEPVELHDYRYLGDDYRERERIKRKKLRWKTRLERMPAQERYALLATIKEIWE